MHNKPAITLRYDRFEIDPNLSLAEKMKATGDKLGNLVEVDTERFRFSQVIDSMFYYYQTIQDTTETLNIESIHNSNNNKPSLMKMKKSILSVFFLFFLLLSAMVTFSQNVGVNADG